MKRLLTFLALTCAAATSFAATLNPVQLLNPAGSTAGQAIVSTGSGSAPAWGAVSATSLASQAANTVVANFTGSSASPTAFAMPSCSTSSGILQYTSGTGVTCSTTIWASPPAIGSTTANTGKFTTLQATSAITPSSTAGIVGTTAADNAQAGSIGEEITGSCSSVSMSSGVALNCTSITLTAGDWDVSGTCVFQPAGSTTFTLAGCTANTTSASLGGGGNGLTLLNITFTTGNSQYIQAGTLRVNASTSTTVYLVGQTAFGVSTMAMSGNIWARRRR